MRVDFGYNSFASDDNIVITDIQTSRGSQMAWMNGKWVFNRNFWLTPDNLKIINEIQKIINSKK